MAKTVPSFSQVYRAARHGWRWAPEYRLFVRISGMSAPFRVETQPMTFECMAIPAPPGDPCTIFWQGQPGILDLVPSLNKYQGRPKRIEFWIDEDGLEIPSPQAQPAEVPVVDKPAETVSIEIDKTGWGSADPAKE